MKSLLLPTLTISFPALILTGLISVVLLSSCTIDLTELNGESNSGMVSEEDRKLMDGMSGTWNATDSSNADSIGLFTLVFTVSNNDSVPKSFTHELLYQDSSQNVLKRFEYSGTWSVSNGSLSRTVDWCRDDEGNLTDDCDFAYPPTSVEKRGDTLQVTENPPGSLRTSLDYMRPD